MRKKIYDVLRIIQTWIDRITTGVASVLIGIMFLVIIANVILRGVPAVGGFRWYMEFSQYANVWAMLIAAAGIAVQCTNLRVEAVDTIMKKTDSVLCFRVCQRKDLCQKVDDHQNLYHACFQNGTGIPDLSLGGCALYRSGSGSSSDYAA